MNKNQTMALLLLPMAIILSGCSDKIMDFRNAQIVNGKIYQANADVPFSAFSAANWTPIPRQIDHRFHGKLDTRSSANWTAIPRQTGQFEAA